MKRINFHFFQDKRINIIINIIAIEIIIIEDTNNFFFYSSFFDILFCIEYKTILAINNIILNIKKINLA